MSNNHNAFNNGFGEARLDMQYKDEKQLFDLLNKTHTQILEARNRLSHEYWKGYFKAVHNYLKLGKVDYPVNRNGFGE